MQATLIGRPPYLFKGRENLSAMTNVVGLAGLDIVQGLAATGSVAGVKVLAEVVPTAEFVAYPNCKLLLTKWIEPRAAQVGEEVTVYLRYFNKALEPMADVAVSDSLVGRLEYVPGTAKSDRPASFSVQANEAGSLILRWEIAGRLLPGETGLLTFKARVR